MQFDRSVASSTTTLCGSGDRASSPREFPVSSAKSLYLLEIGICLEWMFLLILLLLNGPNGGDRSSHYSEEEIPELTLPALADWLARAHAQQLPKGMSLYWIPWRCTTHEHVFWSTRNRMLNWPGVKKHTPFRSKNERMDSGCQDQCGNDVEHPPIEITLTNYHGRLDLYIPVYWSPWVEAGSAEAELLKSCLHELEKQGCKQATSCRGVIFLTASTMDM